MPCLNDELQYCVVVINCTFFLASAQILGKNTELETELKNLNIYYSIVILGMVCEYTLDLNTKFLLIRKFFFRIKK